MPAASIAVLTLALALGTLELFMTDNLAGDAFQRLQATPHLVVPIAALAKQQLLHALATDATRIATLMRRPCYLCLDPSGTVVERNVDRMNEDLLWRSMPQLLSPTDGPVAAAAPTEPAEAKAVEVHVQAAGAKGEAVGDGTVPEARAAGEVSAPRETGGDTGEEDDMMTIELVEGEGAHAVVDSPVPLTGNSVVLTDAMTFVDDGGVWTRTNLSLSALTSAQVSQETSESKLNKTKQAMLSKTKRPGRLYPSVDGANVPALETGCALGGMHAAEPFAAAAATGKLFTASAIKPCVLQANNRLDTISSIAYKAAGVDRTQDAPQMCPIPNTKVIAQAVPKLDERTVVITIPVTSSCLLQTISTSLPATRSRCVYRAGSRVLVRTTLDEVQFALTPLRLDEDVFRRLHASGKVSEVSARMHAQGQRSTTIAYTNEREAAPIWVSLSPRCHCRGSPTGTPLDATAYGPRAALSRPPPTPLPLRPPSPLPNRTAAGVHHPRPWSGPHLEHGTVTGLHHDGVPTERAARPGRSAAHLVSER